MTKLLALGSAIVAATGVCGLLALRRRHSRMRARIDREFGVQGAGVPNLLRANSFWRAYQREGTFRAPMDDITWNDLDMDAVYVNLDHCQSGVGDLWMYAALRAGGELRPREELPAFFEERPALRRQVQYSLARLGRRGESGVETALFDPQSLKLSHPRLLACAAALPLLALCAWPLLGAAAGATMSVAALFANLALTFYLRNRPGSGFDAVCDFSAALACTRRLEKQLRGERAGWADGLAAAASPFRKFSLPIAIINFSDTAFQLGAVDVSSFFLLPVLSYLYVTRQLERRRADALRMIRQLGEIDAAIGILSLRKMLPYWCRPDQAQGREIAFESVYHPLLEEPVANSGTFREEAVFTGSNASGKSTFIKTIAVNCVLGQAIGTCCAKTFYMRRESRVLTSMAVRDDILAGSSYFAAELRSIRRILEELETGAFCYVFLDEVLRGTNTRERVAGAAALLGYLERQGCLAMAATHDVELTELLKERCKNYHFEEEATGDGITFDYKLRPGPAVTKNALKLMRAMQYPPQVFEDAERLIAEYEKSGSWGILPP